MISRYCIACMKLCVTRSWALLFILFTGIANGVELDREGQYSSVIVPLLKDHCISCHGVEKKKGRVSLHDIGIEIKNGKSMDLWARVLEQIETGEMPPEDERQPTAIERQLVVNWIKDTLVLAGRGFELKSKLLLPEHGNRVSHELLFNGEIKGPAFTPSRLWRMSPHVYRGKRYPLRVAGGIEAEPVAYASKASGIRDYASQEIMGESGFLSLKMALDDIISNQLHAKESYKAITEAKEFPSSDAMCRVIREEFHRSTGRSIKPEEMDRYLTFMQKNLKQGGLETGLKISILGIYLSTEAVYRMELGRGDPDEHGRQMLSPQEVSLALAYAFADTPPSQIPILQQALKQDQLSQKEDIEIVVRRMIAAGHPPLRRNMPAAYFPRMIQEGEHGYGWYPRIVRFFEEFFLYPKAAGTFKDSPGEAIGSRALVGAPQGHVSAILNEDNHVFEELLTSPRFNNNKFAMLARLKNRYAKDLNRVTPEQALKRYNEGLKHARHLKHETFRAGILTDNSWLIAHSTNDANDPVHRGIWIRQRLLAGNVPDLPIGVDASVPEDPHKTLRERFEVTRKEECWKCHRTINPLGMPFESFDDRGWVRKALYFDRVKNIYLPQPFIHQEQLEKLRQKGVVDIIPVDASGEIFGTGEPGIDGPVRDAREFVQRLARSTRVRQSIIRHAFRFWMGRNEMLSDSVSLIAADQAYVQSGGKFSEVLVALLTSDSFLYRKADHSLIAKTNSKK